MTNGNMAHEDRIYHCKLCNRKFAQSLLEVGRPVNGKRQDILSDLSVVPDGRGGSVRDRTRVELLAKLQAHSVKEKVQLTWGDMHETFDTYEIVDRIDADHRDVEVRWQRGGSYSIVLRSETTAVEDSREATWAAPERWQRVTPIPAGSQAWATSSWSRR